MRERWLSAKSVGDLTLTSVEDVSPERLAEIHAASFPQAWSKANFVDLMSAGASGLLLTEAGTPVGLLYWRVAADEAEILTVAVHPDHRRKGGGRKLLTETLRVLSITRIDRVFLEVAEDNGPAIHLYRSLGFATVGRRKGYYPRDDQTVDAQVLQLKLNTEGH